MNQNFITSKLDALSKEFQLTLNVDLWKNVPHDQVDNIKVSVKTKDEFTARIISLTAIFDCFNKKVFDRKTEIITKGTRDSFITLLKKEFANNHCQIQIEIDEPLGIICLLRDHIAHGLNKNYQKAFEYFKEKYPVENWSDLWAKVISKFGEILDSILSLLKEKDRNLLKSSEINDNLLDILKQETLSEVLRCIENGKSKSMLREVACRGEILDTELSSIFNMDVEEVRRCLFPFLENILVVKPNDINSTKLKVVEFMRENIKTI